MYKLYKREIATTLEKLDDIENSGVKGEKEIVAKVEEVLRLSDMKDFNTKIYKGTAEGVDYFTITFIVDGYEYDFYFFAIYQDKYIKRCVYESEEDY